jgi:hypothetical protein
LLKFQDNLGHTIEYMMLPMLLLAAEFQAGAAKVSVAPETLPVIVNCFFNERTVDKLTSPLEAKALVLASGQTRIAIALVDSCMMPRDLVDEAKYQASQRTQIPEDRILISATHTHFAPAAMSCLGSRAQPGYPEFLAAKIAEAIAKAAENIEPAQLGAASVDDHEHTFNRRFIYKLDQPLTSPFGEKNVIANMHPGYENPNAVTPSGPVDPALTLLSVKNKTGKPIALLANYSMHYFASEPLSADYFGLFAQKMQKRLGSGNDSVVMMTQGTSGDLMWMDYSKPKRDITLEDYTEGVAASAMRAYEKIVYKSSGPLAMDEAKMTIQRRLPNAERIVWAEKLLAALNGAPPKTQPEIYAREQLYLRDEPRRELKLQALRIGDLAITAMPNEVFALTGLKLKARSPLPLTMNITLANGADGYIPPREQHELGGYTTWAARTAGLDTGAENTIVQTLLEQLENVTGKRRRKVKPGNTKNHWTLDDMEDSSAPIDGPRAYYLEGKTGKAAYFAGAKLRWPKNDKASTFEFCYWPAATKKWERVKHHCAKGAACPDVTLEGKIDDLTLIR